MAILKMRYRRRILNFSVRNLKLKKSEMANGKYKQHFQFKYGKSNKFYINFLIFVSLINLVFMASKFVAFSLVF